MGGDGWGWVGMGWDGDLGSVGRVRMGVRMGTSTGRDSCAQEMVLFTFSMIFHYFESLWMGLRSSWA